jgi:hypothetical protein
MPPKKSTKTATKVVHDESEEEVETPAPKTTKTAKRTTKKEPKEKKATRKSGWSVFCSEKRTIVRDKLAKQHKLSSITDTEEKKEANKVIFRETAKKLGEMWKGLPDKEREVYNKQAQEENDNNPDLKKPAKKTTKKTTTKKTTTKKAPAKKKVEDDDDDEEEESEEESEQEEAEESEEEDDE